MAIRKDYRTSINLPSVEKFKKKVTIRNFLIKKWISENPKTKYRYFVETLKNGSRIYLERPAQLNKGCDFVIYIENFNLWKNGNDRPPNHKFVIKDLKKKKKQLSAKQWNNFLLAVKEIYKSSPYSDTVKYTKRTPKIGLDFELLLKLIRWFFIEQDVTYWSGLGREMFYNSINEI